MTESAVPASGSRRSEPATAGPSCAFRMVAATLLTHSSRESSRTLCKHFTSVSPDLSGHRCQTDRAPMLVGTPLPVILSVFRALGPALWIRRVLVRAQEGQLEARWADNACRASPVLDSLLVLVRRVLLDATRSNSRGHIVFPALVRRWPVRTSPTFPRTVQDPLPSRGVRCLERGRLLLPGD